MTTLRKIVKEVKRRRRIKLDDRIEHKSSYTEITTITRIYEDVVWVLECGHNYFPDGDQIIRRRSRVACIACRYPLYFLPGEIIAR